ncbi:MAG: hypothetical protein Q9174_005318, partial [Haloplaca sp. 1 TL-2023]
DLSSGDWETGFVGFLLQPEHTLASGILDLSAQEALGGETLIPLVLLKREQLGITLTADGDKQGDDASKK